MPEAPIGLVDSTPPDMLTGRSPSSSVTPASVSFQPSPSSAKPRFSSHMGSYQENGTYISPASMSRRGSAIPACRYTSAAQSLPACGDTASLPAKSVGPLRGAPPRTQAGGPGARAAPARSVSTMAQAPSEEGQVSEYRIGSQSMGE